MERRLAALFAADVEAYSRLMGEDEAATFETLTSHRAILDGFIAEHRGRIANTAGDSVLADSASFGVSSSGKPVRFPRSPITARCPAEPCPGT